MTEAPSMVGYSTGVMDSLVDKLIRAKKTYLEVDPLLQDLVRLREDLVNRFARGRATHWQVRVWMRQNRQLFYDIEDMIDLKLGRTKDVDESDKGDFEEQIDVFKARIKEASTRGERYDLPDKAPTSDADGQEDAAPSKVPFDSQLIWEKKGVIVGINKPSKELKDHLEHTQKKKKVVSVLGMEGLGKTTLATKVYETLKDEFDCRASVTVGQNSSMAALKDVFLQVNPEMVGQALNEQEVIAQLWEFLTNKSYFFFIDDIRNERAWSVINCALPNNKHGSRILATMRVKDVAMSCSVPPVDVIYEMKGLEMYDSRELLNSMIPAPTETSFEKKCHDMLKMCCGLPLAIIVTSGLLALKSADLGSLWKLEESSLSTLDQNSMSDVMRNVLDICFADLSPPVKACFLYLGTFPENYTIKKGRLIWRWVAEGFIPKIGQASMWKTGEGYFNELICRRLIQPVFDDYSSDDQAVVCTVHPVIHDFIASLSRQEDFHTTAAELISGPFPYSTIRRFSVDCSRQENNEADTLKSSKIHLSRVRSLTIFGVAGSLPDLRTFKHLRVLDLEDTKSLDDQQAERIELLFLLRYLGLAGTNITKLPQQIMALEHLATLDLRRTEVRELPSFGSNKLLSLFAPFVTIPRGMEGMEELEELSEVLLGRDVLLNLDGSHAEDVARLVSKSRQLTVLGVKFGYLPETEPEGMNHFFEKVGESNLQSLSLDDYLSGSFASLVKCWAHKQPLNLQKFELRICDFFQLVPADITSIIALTHLHIQVKVVEAQGVRALGRLPKLILLKLFSEEGSQERLSVSKEDGFPSLKVFWFSSYFHGMELQFKEGAMPHLHRLQIEFNARKTMLFYGSYDFGIQHLCCLRQVSAIIRRKDATDSEAKAAEAAIRGQVSQIRHKDATHSETKAAEAAIRDQVSQIPYDPLPMYGDDKSPKEEATRETDNSTTYTVDIKISILPESSSHLPLPEIISFGMEDAMVSSFTGAMKSVLMKHKILMVKGTIDKQELIPIDELQHMNGLLKKLSGTPDLNNEMKECRNQMRELTYDIDDSIDDLMLSSVKEEGSKSSEKKVIPHDFIDQIKKLNEQVKMADLRSNMVHKTERRIFGPRRMPREQWLTSVYYYELQKQVQRDESSNIEWMRKTFADLSSDMKTCLLYFSRFRANEVLKKDRLIRMWAAEGFLPKGSVETWWETGENCFLELIIRRLIEPVYDYYYMGEDVLPTGCKVGGSVHAFITSLSGEENFVKPGQHGVFWQLSSSPFETKQDKLETVVKQRKRSKARSLTVDFGYSRKPKMCDLSAFIHLRVLDLKDLFGSLPQDHLRSVGLLSLLRYLGFEGTRLESLPQEIIALEHLEAVDIRCKELPAFKSRKLVSLIGDNLRLPPIEMGEMQVLEELSTVRVGRDGDRLAKVVNESKRLRRLGVAIGHAALSAQGRKGLMDLLVAIENSSIQSLQFNDWSCDGPALLDLLLSCWAQKRPRHLRKLVLQLGVYSDPFPEVPQELSSSLIYLTHLSIGVRTVNTKGLCTLGNLPNLVVLSLIQYSRAWMAGRSIISKNGFRCLMVFLFRHARDGGMDLQFEAGAMPQLRRLQLDFNAEETMPALGGVDFGIHYLTCLMQVHAFVNCWDSNRATVEAVEAAIKDEVSRNRNNPVLEITRKREDRMVLDTVRDEGHTSHVEDPKDKDRKFPY